MKGSKISHSTRFFCIISISTMLIACSGDFDPFKMRPFILSSYPEIQQLEKKDHNFCVDLITPKGQKPRLPSPSNAIYWQCRLATAKKDLSPENDSAEDLDHNLRISDLIKEISKRISASPEEDLLNSNKRVDDRQHKKCLKMGFTDDTDDQAILNEYFNCRRALIEEQKFVPSFGKEEYEPFLNHSYNLSFVIDRYLDKKNLMHQSITQKYPDCANLNPSSTDFKNCKAAQDKAAQCYKEIPFKRAKKELAERSSCQRQSYIRFPDDMMKNDDRYAWKVEDNQSNDYFNSFDFAAAGSDSLVKFGAAKIAADKQKEQEKAKLSNSSSELYSKYELAKLRQKYIYSCNKETNNNIADYTAQLEDECQSMKKFKKQSEED